MSKRSLAANAGGVRLTPQMLRQMAANIRAIEAQAHAPAFDGQYLHDRICAANASLFSEAFFSQPLTTYAAGWRDTSDLEAALEFFAPMVRVPRRFEYALQTNIEEFLKDADDIRPIKGNFKEVEYTEAKVNAKTNNHGLMITVDRDQVADKANWQEHYTQKLLRRLRRNSLMRAIALISAAATNTAKTWDTTAGKDPDQDVLTELVTATNLSGVRPNRVGYGDTAWSKRILSHRAQDTAGGYASAGLTPEQVASFLGVDQVHHNKSRYQNTAAAKAEVVGNLVLMFLAEAGMDTEDPSNIKRFVSDVDGGGLVRVFVQEINAKLVSITVEHYELTKITSTLGIRKFTVS
jgi:hypothetical protein